MTTLVLSALLLILATPVLAADAGKPATTQSQTPAPAIQSDAVKPLTQPGVVAPPSAKPVTAPKVIPPVPSGGPSVSGPKAAPGVPSAGPAAPTPPAAGIPGIDPRLGSTIRDASQLDRMRTLEDLEKLYGDPAQRNRPGGAGDEGPFSPATLGRGIDQPPGHQGPEGYHRDCLKNPQDCIGGSPHDRFGSGNAGDRMGGPPTAAGGLIRDPGGAVSSDQAASCNEPTKPRVHRRAPWKRRSAPRSCRRLSTRTAPPRQGRGEQCGRQHRLLGKGLRQRWFVLYGPCSYRS